MEKVELYMAKDGRYFTTQEECLKHEEKINNEQKIKDNIESHRLKDSELEEVDIYSMYSKEVRFRFKADRGYVFYYVKDKEDCEKLISHLEANNRYRHILYPHYEDIVFPDFIAVNILQNDIISRKNIEDRISELQRLLPIVDKAIERHLECKNK